METLLRLVTFLCTLFSLLMTAIVLFTYRRERRVGVLSTLLSVALSLLMLGVFVLLSGACLNWLVALPALALGLLVGFVRGMATRLYYRDGWVVGRNSMLFLLGWGASLVLAQVLTLLGSALLASLGLLGLFLGTGTQVGIGVNVLLRRLFLRPPPAEGGAVGRSAPGGVG
jgi:hypothetical protein